MDPLRPTVLTQDRVVPPAMPGVRAGEVLGEWRIERQIGAGGMGAVYAAVHTVIGKRAALKVIRGRMAECPHAAERFLQEARVVNQIRHPNIVDIFQIGQLADGRPYLVMELLHGETLGDRIDRSRVPATEAIDMLLQICEALGAAHACGVIHRDLKPDNVFLCGDQVKLLDWGIAKLLVQPPGAPNVTDAGTMVGTPRYLAPEQARNQPVDERSDVYSLGCIAHELFLEAPPFTADNVADLLVAHLTQPVAPPSEVWPDIPPALERVILGMLEKDAALRPTLPEVVAALHEVRRDLGGRASRFAHGSGPVAAPVESAPPPLPVTGTEPTVESQLPPPAPRTSRGAWSVIAGSVLLATVTVIALSTRPRALGEPASSAASRAITVTPLALPPVQAPAAIVPQAKPREHHVSPKRAEASPSPKIGRPGKLRARQLHPDDTIDPFVEP